MEEKTSGAGPESSSSSSSRGGGGGGPTGKKSRYAVDDIDQGGDPIECSGKHCRSCTAGFIADCVALCCCPCALWNILGLAFVKVPLMVGRKCLGRGKRRRKRKCKKKESDDDGVVVERECNLARNAGAELGISEFEFCGFVDGGGGAEEEKGRLSAKSEAERVWMELYQVGHLGFGRVSISG
ncbi:hypothetical protein HS088_TW11G00445 [Tripterygium wilfordii]|uniref:Uncharacterized protein n=1 Tax=Tripterygium wilfordii TaxID=458696 RepID=A0A7J7D2T5_TRIWF|nr:uncharacterized protein LOC120009288 [Tripterygium wilfordii]KAF5740376.1 hypothetical protein HS088_TW11G00445 [Tripterygium wilfordii]